MMHMSDRNSFKVSIADIQNSSEYLEDELKAKS